MVLAANGEVHTNEEAQEHVHDLNLFVTVQSLEDTPDVLSLGTLCEDHGYSYERTSSKATPDQTREDYFKQDGQPRTSCCPWVIHQFCLQLVFNIDKSEVTD